MDMRFEVGGTAWWAHATTKETSVECPDCGGTGRLRVTFHDETMVSIDCQNCARGYEPPTGRIPCYDRTPNAELVTIKGFEFRDGQIRWQTTGSYVVDDDMLFDNEIDALAKCGVMAREADQAERDRIFKKEKDTRSWAWNASYHRKEIKEAKRRIEYHTSKLEAANIKQRKPK